MEGLDGHGWQVLDALCCIGALNFQISIISSPIMRKRIRYGAMRGDSRGEARGDADD